MSVGANQRVCCRVFCAQTMADKEAAAWENDTKRNQFMMMAYVVLLVIVSSFSMNPHMGWCTVGVLFDCLIVHLMNTFWATATTLCSKVPRWCREPLSVVVQHVWEFDWGLDGVPFVDATDLNCGWVYSYDVFEHPLRDWGAPGALFEE